MSKSPPAADAARSRTMSRIKGKNTSIEVSLRKALWRAGIRYRVNYAELPGAPDIAIPKYQVAIFCDGEFWHGKDWATKKDKLHSNRDYWVAKIERNMRRDFEVSGQLGTMDWTVIRFWGSEIHNNLGDCVGVVQQAIFQSEYDSCETDWDFGDI